MTLLPGVSGRLISATFAGGPLQDVSDIRAVPPHLERDIARWEAACEASLGPAASVRAVADAVAVPLLRLLGFQVRARRDTAAACELHAAAEAATLPVLVVGWGEPMETAWRAAVARGIAADARWCLCTNGRALRLIDAHRTWTRQHLEFDLASVAQAPDALRVFWTLLRAEAIAGPDPLLDRAVALSARHGLDVCRALGKGVLEALGALLEGFAGAEAGRGTPPVSGLLDPAITVLYRMLFLLFAEARGLVPTWHPVYRDRYTIDGIVSALAAGERCRGIWPALQAIARLAHAGCRAGDLQVTPFNGRLFSPSHAPRAERAGVDDRPIARALLALGTMPDGTAGRARISYRDLDVEQLGAVYEHVLDYEPGLAAGRVALRRCGDARKASGTFYTPRSLTACLVRRTLWPLLRGRSAAGILRLRVVDPAMGSGAFLVAACRYLASAVEEARVRDGEWHPADVTAADRAALRREIALRCLYGADLNPVAVQLARLSLWLATLADDKPLSFLDHHLVAGDSLAGAALADLASPPPGRGRRHGSSDELPLFDGHPGITLGGAARTRLQLTLERDDSVQAVRRKEAALEALRGAGSQLGRWKAVLDLWCACWFWEPGPPPAAALFRDLSGVLLEGRSALPPRLAGRWLDRAAEIAAIRRFLHWELEFPEVFFDEDGTRAPDGGFDAVIGNPPWDMVRGDSGAAGVRHGRQTEARRLLDFVRKSGVYGIDFRAHVNRYQLFVERALQLLRPGGRLGLVLPSGLVSDAGCGPLRRFLFDRAAVDGVLGLDNRRAIFPIHRSMRFVLLTATSGASTDRVACRFGIHDPADLDAIDAGGREAFPVTISRAFVARVSGDEDLAIPELASATDLRLVEKIAASHPWLSSSEGWGARFGRELNATDDRAALAPVSGDPAARPVLEGKLLSPFRAEVERCSLELRSPEAIGRRAPRRPRLAYREVAGATNRLTLIAGMVPARAVTTHTLFCLRTPMAVDRQLLLCALLNSFVANYLVRLRVNTHVTAAIVSRLFVPRVADGDPAGARLQQLAHRLTEGSDAVEEMPEYAEAQAVAAALYRLTPVEFDHVLATFPLVDDEVKERARERFRAMRGPT